MTKMKLMTTAAVLSLLAAPSLAQEGPFNNMEDGEPVAPMNQMVSNDDRDQTGDTPIFNKGNEDDSIIDDANELAEAKATDPWFERIEAEFAALSGMTADDLVGYTVATNDGQTIGDIDRFEEIDGRFVAIVAESDAFEFGQRDLGLELSQLDYDGLGFVTTDIASSDVEIRLMDGS